ncbi:MAG: c-type cytochrome, partial [Planctomycetales bacterium]|nr:c-type cytochrome [Planctomycetales bacterium]
MQNTMMPIEEARTPMTVGARAALETCSGTVVLEEATRSSRSARTTGRGAWAAAILLAVTTITGCAREPIPDYPLALEAPETTAGEEGAEAPQLPERHQAQIEEFLKLYFGTPTFPRLATPADEDAEEAEASDDAAAAEGPAVKDLVDRRGLAYGARVYRTRCAGCHGVMGDGKGAAAGYLVPKPRDYRRGVYKFTSTPYGYKPTRADLIRTIRRGAKGTSMPAFPWMSDEDLNAVIDYVISISQRGEVEQLVMLLSEDYDPEEDIDPADLQDSLSNIQERWDEAQSEAVQPVTAPPAYDDESIRAGRVAFLSQGCAKCHGVNGEGQTEWLSPEFLAEQKEL